MSQETSPDRSCGLPGQRVRRVGAVLGGLWRAGLGGLVLLAILVAEVWADDPLRCAAESAGTSNPPSGRVRFELKSLRLNSDMEDADDWVLLWDDKADVRGSVQIDPGDGGVQDFAFPGIDENNFPHWNEKNVFESRPAVPGVPVRFLIQMYEEDWVSGIDMIDLNPDPAKTELEFWLNTCSGRLSGDVTGSTQGSVPVTSGTAWNQGTLMFKISMEDERPLSTVASDVALTGFDLIQVVPGTRRLVAGEPAVALVQVANNTPSPQAVSVRLVINDAAGTVLYDGTEVVPGGPGGGPLAPGQVAKHYMATADPLVFSGGCEDSEIFATATLVLGPGAEPPPTTVPMCWATNNSTGQVAYRLTSTRPLDLVWMRTGSGPAATAAELVSIRNIGMPFIQGVYPARVSSSTSPVSLVPPIAVTFSAIKGLFGALGEPVDVALPYALVYELDAAAALAGVDRLMGVMPGDWFDSLPVERLKETTGVSFGTWKPHAVIFEARSTSSSDFGTRMALPAHELGHTFGLSMDPAIKNPLCSLAGDLGVIACGILGGFDEYRNEDHPNGLPTWGYWIEQGGPATPAPQPGTAGENCESHCMMGDNPVNAELNWGTRRRWIDAADYDQVVDELHAGHALACQHGWVNDAVYLTGLIGENDQAYLGWVLHRSAIPGGVAPDLRTQAGEHPAAYALRFLDGSGHKLSEVEVPLSWNHADLGDPVPATFFGGWVAWPAGTRKIELWNRVRGNLLAERNVSSHSPAVSVPTVAVVADGTGGQRLAIRWNASDPDGDPLRHFVQMSSDGTTFWPVAHALEAPAASLPLAEIPQGRYRIRVLSHDGVHATSRETSFVR